MKTKGSERSYVRLAKGKSYQYLVTGKRMM